jgi:hypothetical protein
MIYFVNAQKKKREVVINVSLLDYICIKIK